MRTWLEVIGAMWSAETVAVLGSSNLQVLKLPNAKSESVALGLCEERVSARKLEKQELRPREVRFTPSSRNSPGRATPPGVLLLLVKLKPAGRVMFAPFTIALVLLELPPTNWREPVLSFPTHL